MVTFQTLPEKKFGGLQIVNVPILVKFSKQQQKLQVCIFLAFGTWNNILIIIDRAHTLNQKCQVGPAFRPRQYLSLSYQLRSHCYDSGLISLSRQNIEETVMVKRRIFLPHFLPQKQIGTFYAFIQKFLMTFKIHIDLVTP